MNWFNFSKIDFRFVFSQRMFIMLFPILAIVIGINTGISFIVTYLCFGVLVISTTPFYVENKGNSAFVLMLPGNERDRVIGRYMTFVINVIIASSFGVVASFVLQAFGCFQIKPIDLVMCGTAVVATLIIGSLQLFLFYAVGRDKNEQVMNIMRLVPGFIFFFGSMSFFDAVEENPESVVNLIEWLNRFKYVLLSCGAATAVILLVVCIVFSARIIKKRDLG